MPVRRVLAVIPSRNEEQALPAVIASLREAAARLCRLPAAEERP